MNANRGELCLLLLFLLLPEILLLAFFTIGYVLESSHDIPRQVDVVVVLGGGSGERYLAARALALSGLSKNILLINPLLDECKDAANIGNISIWIDNLPRNSWQEAKAVRAWMEAYGWKSVIVVSDPPHMLRLRYAWSSVFRNSDLSFLLVATKPAWWSAATWWSNPRSNVFVESEVLKLGYYILNYRFGIF